MLTSLGCPYPSIQAVDDTFQWPFRVLHHLARRSLQGSFSGTLHGPSNPFGALSADLFSGTLVGPTSPQLR
jgi:hypothetical protein